MTMQSVVVLLVSLMLDIASWPSWASPTSVVDASKNQQSGCNSSDVDVWHALSANCSEDQWLVNHLSRIYRTCGMIFLRPARLQAKILEELGQSLARIVEKGQLLNLSSQHLLEASTPLRGHRQTWLPSLELVPLRILDALGCIVDILQLAWGRAVQIDFLALLGVPPNAPAQRFHADSTGMFAKMQLALHPHSDADGGISFLPANSADSVDRCRANRNGAHDLDSCLMGGSSTVGLPGGSAFLGDMVLYSGKSMHRGGKHMGTKWKLVLDVSFSKGPAQGQEQAAKHRNLYFESMWGNGVHGILARVWTEQRRDWWAKKYRARRQSEAWHPSVLASTLK